MPDTYLLEVVTPEEEIFSEQVYSLRAPAHEGNLGVLPGHAPMLCSLKPGSLIIRRTEEDNDPEYISITGGFLEVQPDHALVLADAAERTPELDIERAREAYIRAFNRLYTTEGDEEEIDREQAEQALNRARARLVTAQQAGEDVDIPEPLG